MFELTADELTDWRYQFGTSNRIRMGLRRSPFAFSEHGVLMLASVLKSDRAALVNIWIVRVFTRLRELLTTNQYVIQALEEIGKRVTDHDSRIQLLFEYLKQLEEQKQSAEEFQNRSRIGFKREKEKD
jgi:hypothetical protein